MTATCRLLPPLCLLFMPLYPPLNLHIGIYNHFVALKVYPSPFNTTNGQENNTISFVL